MSVCCAFSTPLQTLSSPCAATELHLLQSDIDHRSEPSPLGLFADHVLSFVGSDPDTMLLHEALCQPDCAQFILAMQKELQDHIDCKHWKVVPLSSIPP